MARSRKTHHEPAAELRWRSRQRPGAIMRPATFERIVRKTMARYGIGRARAEKIAGRAYWTTVKARYRHATHARTR